MKHETYDIVWNNVRFTPPRDNIWYRGVTQGEILNSSIKRGSNVVGVSFFTYGDIFKDEPLKEGWSVVLYDNHEIIAYKDLMTKDFIIANDVADAERQALEWVKGVDNKRNYFNNWR